MADVNAYPILSICATVDSKLQDLEIKNGQLIFVQDKHKIALDYGDKRVFYRHIKELETEEERKALLAPVSGLYYFVIDTAVLWTYRASGWIQITTPPKEIVFIGTELPELGSNKTLYVDTLNKEISIWDDTSSKYVVVADKKEELTAEDIDALFNKNNI